MFFRFVPTQLEKFGPKDVVGVAVALGRLQAGASLSLSIYISTYIYIIYFKNII